jgi:NADH dehydrogenase
VYEIGGPVVLTMAEVISTMLDVMGKRRLVVPIPTVLAKLGVAPLVLLPTPPMTPGGIEFAVQDGLADNTEVTKTLKIEPIDLRSGLQRYL